MEKLCLHMHRHGEMDFKPTVMTMSAEARLLGIRLGTGEGSGNCGVQIKVAEA